MQNNYIKKIAQEAVSQIKIARSRVEKRQSGILRKIEGNYQESLVNNGFSLGRALATGTYIYMYNLLALEAIFIAIMVFVAFISTGVIGYFDGEHILLVILFWTSITLLHFIVIYMVSSLFLLVHLMYNGRYIATLLFSILISALLVSYLIPEISLNIFNTSGLGFGQLALPIVALYLTTQLFLFVQYKDKLCYHTYRKRMQRADFIAVIDPEKKGRILVLTAQDHYVEITSTNGKKLVRMRMREAIAQMQDQDGLSVHRSYWVAKDAIQSLQKSEGKHFLLLINGDKIPVSPSKLAGVKEALNL